MSGNRCQTRVWRLPRILLRILLATLGVAAPRVGAATAADIPFADPYVIAEANIPLVTGDLVFDVVPIDALVLRPMRANAVASSGPNVVAVGGLANVDGALGFNAVGVAIDVRGVRTGYGSARSAMSFQATSPAGEGRVKVVVNVRGAASAGTSWQDWTSASFNVGVGQLRTPGLLSREAGDLRITRSPEFEVPDLMTLSAVHQRRPQGGTSSRVTVQANGYPIDEKVGSGPVLINQALVLNVPADTPIVVQVYARVQGNAVAFIDPVIEPHPDNPDATITLRGAHDPTSARVSLPSADVLTAAGIDVGPLEELGLLDEPEPACSDGTTVEKARLVIRKAGTADSKLRLRGDLARRPLDPPFDPVAHGVRVRVEDADGTVVIDDRVPGGAFDPVTAIGWRHDPEQSRWTYTHPGQQGIRRVVVTRRAGSDETYRFTATAHLPESPVPTGDRLPLTATIVADPTAASGDQCARTILGDGSPGTACPVQSDTRLVCRRGTVAAGE